MIVGVPKETERQEWRVAMTPAEVGCLTATGHTVLVEEKAGSRVGFSDEEYALAGADIRPAKVDVYSHPDMIVKVRPPSAEECLLLRQDQILFSYLYAAACPERTRALLDRKIIGIACEAMQLADGTRPLLACVDEVAGRLAIQLGTQRLQTDNGGSGLLLGGAPGVPPARVAVIGGGAAGVAAAQTAAALGARVTLLGCGPERRRHPLATLPAGVTVLPAYDAGIERVVVDADLVVGALIGPESQTRPAVTRTMMARMRKGSVVVDLAVEQGGCVEGTVPVSLDRPDVDIDGVTLVCPTGIVGAAARTATMAFAAAAYPYIASLAARGCAETALLVDAALAQGLTMWRGRLVSKSVAQSLGIDYRPWNGSALQKTGTESAEDS